MGGNTCVIRMLLFFHSNTALAYVYVLVTFVFNDPRGAAVIPHFVAIWVRILMVDLSHYTVA